MTNFKIGQKLICVEDKNFTNGGENIPLKNKIYTIRDMIIYRGIYCFRFEEIVNFPRLYIEVGFVECYFAQDAFKPLEYVSANSEILEKFKITEERPDVEIKELEKHI